MYVPSSSVITRDYLIISQISWVRAVTTWFKVILRIEPKSFLPENDALQVEGVLYDSCSGDAHS